tara:strand:- start:941 stop:1366 length:426 start_codon:yes stop_codon:yes gene_type:complete
MGYGEILSSFFIDLQSIFRKKIKIKNASFQQIMALATIPSKGIEMTPLAKKIGIDNSTATRLIKRMEDNGWVNRVVSSHDKRVTEVRLTNAGSNMQIEIEKQCEKIGEMIEKSMNRIDRQAVHDSIQSLHWTLIKMDLDKQ